jgi:hypothetical protein
MAQIIGFNRKRTFSLQEAREVFPLVRRITRVAQEEVKVLWEKQSFQKDPKRKASCDGEVQAVFKSWQEKVARLGAHGKGMWLVDFDSGDGYFCWHYPEPDISFFHGYNEGFRGRQPLQPLQPKPD